MSVLTGKEPYSFHMGKGEGNPLKGDEDTPGVFPQSSTLDKRKMSTLYNKENASSRFKKFKLPDEFIVQTPVLSHKNGRGIMAMRSTKQPGGGSKHTIDINNESKLTNIDRMKLEDSTIGIFNSDSRINFLEYDQKDKGQGREHPRIQKVGRMPSKGIRADNLGSEHTQVVSTKKQKKSDNIQHSSTLQPNIEEQRRASMRDGEGPHTNRSGTMANVPEPRSNRMVPDPKLQKKNKRNNLFNISMDDVENI